MASMYRRYRRNSPEAMAAVVAALLIGGGRIDPLEVDFMDRVGMFSIIGVPRELFMKVAADVAGERRLDEGTAADLRRMRMARFDAFLDAVENRDQQHLVCAVMVYLAESDHSVDAEEAAMVRHAFRQWKVSAETLERELNVPRSRTQPYLAANPAAGA